MAFNIGRLFAIAAMIVSFLGTGWAADTEVDPGTVSDGLIVLKNSLRPGLRPDSLSPGDRRFGR
jgi:hypothetical protein